MSTSDAPDGQRGTVATAKLLATVPSGTASKSVTVPSNARNLIVLMPQSASAYVPTVTGSTSGMKYPGTLLPVGAFETADECYVTLVWPAVDAVVDVTLDGTPAVDWYILADNADRVTTELTLRSAMGGTGVSKPIDGILVMGSDGTDAYNVRTDTSGRQFTVPQVPGTASGDHPATEITVTGASATVSETFLGKLASTQRYRIFGARVCPESSSTAIGYLGPTSGGAFYHGGEGATDYVSYTNQGYVLPAGDGVNWEIESGSGSVFVMLQYVVETV